jgi:hypothetical protein
MISPSLPVRSSFPRPGRTLTSARDTAGAPLPERERADVDRIAAAIRAGERSEVSAEFADGVPDL